MNNIYQTVREACGITQERAAELIGLSVESIRGYETERRIPSDDTVIKMVDIYDANYLAYQHLKYKTQVGNVVLPDLNSATLPEAALQWVHEINDCMEYQASIIEIAMDGKIDDQEKDVWEHAMEKCRELCRAYFALQFVNKKKEKEE